MEVVVLVSIVVIVVAVIIALGGGSSSSNDNSESDTASSYQEDCSSLGEPQYQAVQQVPEVQQNLPTQWIFTDDNDRFYLAVSLTDGYYCGPITLAELRAFELEPDYWVTTERLEGNWYPAGNFFCLADLFYKDFSPTEGNDFVVNEDGTITRKPKEKKTSGRRKKNSENAASGAQDSESEQSFRINEDGTITRLREGNR